jgi:hypothetical protein
MNSGCTVGIRDTLKNPHPQFRGRTAVRPYCSEPFQRKARFGQHLPAVYN